MESILLSVAFLFTTPIFWVCAGKHNVDNFHILALPLILLLAIKQAEGTVKWNNAWPGYTLLILLSPIHGGIYGFYFWVSSAKDKTIHIDLLKIGFYIIALSTLAYFIPAITQKVLGFDSVSSGWLHRAGLDGNDEWDGNVLSAIFNPRPIPRNTILMLFFSGILNRLPTNTNEALKHNFSPYPTRTHQIFLICAFMASYLPHYIITCLLWPQSVSIHPYIYDFQLLGPIAFCIALHFGLLNYWKSTNPFGFGLCYSNHV